MPREKVLITGASGLIGSAVRSCLEDQYELSALNRRPLSGTPCHQADIADPEAIEPAFAGQDMVVHLAALVGEEGQGLLRANLMGTANVFEAARRAGVRRLVYASSGAVVAGWEKVPPYQALAEGRYGEVPRPWPILDHHAPLRPVGLYAASKVWGEAVARKYADEHGLSVFCLRFGRVNPENRPTRPREYCVWCSQRDAAQMVEKCLAAPAEVRFEVFYVVSDNAWGYRDLSHPRQRVGYVPQDRAEDYR